MRRILAAAALLGLAGAVAFFVIFQFVESERRRDLHDWQVRTGIVADSRFAALDAWLSRQFEHVNGLAQNAALKVYVMALEEGAPAEDDDQERIQERQIEAAYLRNLLAVTAENAGFAPRLLKAEVEANVDRAGVAGMALLDMEGKALVATPDMPPRQGRLADFVRRLPLGERGLLDIHQGSSGSPTMAFAVPLFALHGESVGADQVGYVLGVKEVGVGLYPLLRQPGNPSKTAEAVLVRRKGAVVEYLSPLRDRTAPMARRLAADTPDLAAAFALDHPGGFAIKRDYANNEVLVTSRAFGTVPWTMLCKIDRSEALANSDSRLRRLTITLSLVVGAVGLALIAAWRYATSRRAEQLAAEYRETAEALDKRERFLQVLTDKQPGPIFTISAEGVYGFANAALARIAGIPVEDIIGKTMESVLGPHYAKRYEPVIKRVIENRQAETEVYRVARGDDERAFQAQHIPIRNIEDTEDIVLVVEEDITAAVMERERRERTLHQIVKTMVTFADSRDPDASGHSDRVAAVARWTAEEMELDDKTVDAVEIAGRLMNLGKLYVPRAILTKRDSLTAEETAIALRGMDRAADLLKDIEFEGPVIDMISQCREHWDGSGRPAGLAGEEIDLGARILIVANAFVAMTSPRAYRDGVEFELALAGVMVRVGKTFDRRVVAALVHQFENTGGNERWDRMIAEEAGDG